MPVPLAIAAVAGVGAAAGIFGSIMGGEEAKKAGDRSARFISQQANEVSRRSKINEAGIFEKVSYDQSTVVSGMRGRYAMPAAGNSIDNLKEAAQKQVDILRQETAWELYSLQNQADEAIRQGKAARTAGYINGIASGAQSAASIASLAGAS